MPIPANYIAAAEAVQRAAASAPEAQVRLIAGPGTGKSSAIERRVCWLLEHGVASDEIYAVSFTRASARDLQERIIDYCQSHEQENAGQVRVSTLHSLALRMLRAAGLLTRYAVDPLVLDNWELENVFDAEFGVASSIRSKTRREQIRYYHEAYWSTGIWHPPNYLPPDPPISQAESNLFLTFHGPRTQLYSCVLPGEIIGQCVEEINAGTIDALTLLHIRHLIVDEFQDLNPMDLDLVRALTDRGVTTFVAGDDDQSIYSFRFATPSGIQEFPQRYPHAARHTLQDCFRCMPSILAVGNSLIQAFPVQNRVAKDSTSLYQHSEPPATGVVHRWRFANGRIESNAIATSCRELIDVGIRPRDILILLNNQRVLASEITTHLEGLNVPFDPPRVDSFLDSPTGRLALAVLRIVSNSDDYVAHRTLLGLRTGVGMSTCHQIAQAVIDNNVNYRNLFYRPLPNNLLSTRCANAVNHARTICARVAPWLELDTIGQRADDLAGLVEEVLGIHEAGLWRNFTAQFPEDMTLRELRDFMWADNDEQQAQIIQGVYVRLGQPVPDDQLLPQRVRIMTMHAAKGLSARIVFIPALEDSLIPGPWRTPFPGLVLEAARLLYVSITRARAACIMSFASRRFVNGRNQPQAPSRFNTSLNGGFVQRDMGLTHEQIQEIVDQCSAI
jgi:DNA helicase II / ATP-dependent DNA helicase PcrA